MTKIDSGYNLHNDETLARIYYTITDNGFEIYLGENSEYPSYAQYEPFIPNPDISYEENAINYAKSLAVPEMETIAKEDADKTYASITEVTNIRSDLDYLMLLNDPDSASETVTE